jgi:hypothetical protein
VAILGGLLAGLGLGLCLAWSLNIFEIAHPQLGVACDGSTGCNMTLYPGAGVTVFAVLVFSGAFGAGLGLVASALICGEGRTSSAPEPAGTAVSSPERRVRGC